MEDNDDLLFVLALAADLPAWLSAPGTKGGYRCARCGAECVAAPSGQRWMKEHPDVPVICMPCILADGQNHELAPPGTVPGQAEEVAQYLKEKVKQAKNAHSN